MSLRFHMALCGTCRKFRNLQQKIQTAVKKHGTDAPETIDSPDDAPVLPEDSRSRINIALQQAMKDPGKK